MDYLIVSVIDGKEQLGTDSNTIVRNAKSMVKVNNALKYFNPLRKPHEIRIYSFSHIYQPESYKLVKTIDSN